MRNLLNAIDVSLLIKRVNSLQVNTNPIWGSMTATEMLGHCNLVHQQMLSQAKPKNKNTSIKQYILRWIVLYIMPRYPRNAKAPKKMLTKGSLNPEMFDAEKEHYIQLLETFPSLTTSITHHHPYFGNISTKEWGLSGWKHADHHLRQFGL